MTFNDILFFKNNFDEKQLIYLYLFKLTEINDILPLIPENSPFKYRVMLLQNYFENDKIESFNSEDSKKFIQISENEYYFLSKNNLYVYRYYDEIKTYRNFIFTNIINNYFDDIALNIESTYYNRLNGQDILYEPYVCTLQDLIEVISENDLVNIISEVLEKTYRLNCIGIVHLNIDPKNIVLMKDCSIRLKDFSNSIFLGSKQSNIEELISSKSFYINGKEVIKLPKMYVNYTTDCYYIFCIYYSFLKCQEFKFIIPLAQGLFESDSYYNLSLIDNLKQEDLFTNCTTNVNRYNCREALIGKKEINYSTSFQCSNLTVNFIENFLRIHLIDRIQPSNYSFYSKYNNINNVFNFRNTYQLLALTEKTIKQNNLENFFRSTENDSFEESAKILKQVKFIPIFYEDIQEIFKNFLNNNMMIPLNCLNVSINELLNSDISIDANVIHLIKNSFLRIIYQNYYDDESEKTLEEIKNTFLNLLA